MHWSVAAAFTRDPETDRWLVPHVPGTRHSFTLVPVRAPSRTWHGRRGPTAGLADWGRTWQQAHDAWRASRGGVITLFPQLAVMAGLEQRLRLARRPVVAWCFNLGAIYGGLKGALARTALSRVDRFVVHSTGEIARYSEWLELPRERFCFVHLQRGLIPVRAVEDEARPFALAMGSARRDYATLFEAVRGTGIPLLVVAAPHALRGLSVPEGVEVRSGLTADECRSLAQRARVNVVPILNDETASGQVTVVEAMRMGRAVVTTRCLGTSDYVEDGVTGLLVRPRAVEELRLALQRVWEDAALRRALGQRAARFTLEHCSDQAAGERLARLLDDVQAARPRSRDLTRPCTR